MASSDKFEQFKSEGNDFFKAGKFDQAIASYSKALKSKDDEPSAYTNRALCYIKTDRFYETIRDCDKALELDSNNTKALYWRAQASRQLYRFQSALDDYTKVKQLDPNIKGLDKELRDIKQILEKDDRIDVKISNKPDRFRSNKPLQEFKICANSGSDKYKL